MFTVATDVTVVKLPVFFTVCVFLCVWAHMSVDPLGPLTLRMDWHSI